MSQASNPDLRQVRRVIFASLIGATIEWYDFFLYGVVAGIVFSKLFFPAGDPFISTLLAYGTFAVGFLSRPIGGVIFGHFGDRIGRKKMLVITLMIMGVGTLLVGFLPTYHQIGVLAPLALLALRVLQGIGLGGEWGGAVLMSFEYAPENRRGLYASLPQIGLALGLCLASGVVGVLSALTTDSQFLAWGWRIAFILSFVLVLVGMYVRLNVMETPAFSSIKKKGGEVKVPIKEVIAKYPGNVLAGMGARFIDGVFFNVFGVFSISYLTQNLNVSRTDALLGVMLAALVMVFTIPYFGRLSDKLGRTKTYFWGSLITGFSALPGFWVMSQSDGSIPIIYLAIIIPFGIFYASIYGPEAALFSELFDTNVRYSGISFVYQFSGIFASGLTPIIAAYLVEKSGGGPWLFCAYVALAGLVSAFSALWIGRRPRSHQYTLKATSY